MALKHPESRWGRTDDLAVAPLFGLEARTIPRNELPRDELPVHALDGQDEHPQAQSGE